MCGPPEDAASTRDVEPKSKSWVASIVTRRVHQLRTYVRKSNHDAAAATVQQVEQYRMKL